MADIERLPWRVDAQLVRALDAPGHLEIEVRSPDACPTLRCVLARPAPSRVSLTIRVHSRAGIPLAHASVQVNPGDRQFEAPLTLLAMEGYTHLSPRARHGVVQRVWSRRAYATGSSA